MVASEGRCHFEDLLVVSGLEGPYFYNRVVDCLPADNGGLALSVEVELFLDKIVLLEQSEFLYPFPEFDYDVVVIQLVDRGDGFRVEPLQFFDLPFLGNFLDDGLTLLLGV